MSEKRLVSYPLRKHFDDRYSGRGVLLRIENYARPGTPDVFMAFSPSAYAWVELKYIQRWSGKTQTIGLNKEQKLFIREWTKKGLVVYVLLRCRDTFLLFNGADCLTSKGAKRWQRLALVKVELGESFDPIFHVLESVHA